MFNTFVRILIVVLAFVIGTLISIFTKNTIRSKHQPPSWVFWIVWTTIYTWYAVMWVYLSKDINDEDDMITIDTLFMVNMILNVLWVVVFFGFRLKWLGAVIIVLLMGVIIAQVLCVAKMVNSKFMTPTIVLLLLYFSWLCFALFLNITAKKV